MVSVQRDNMVRKYPEGNETFFFIYFTDSTGRGLINYTITTVYIASCLNVHIQTSNPYPVKKQTNHLSSGQVYLY
jgi:hypothetical protein